MIACSILHITLTHTHAGNIVQTYIHTRAFPLKDVGVIVVAGVQYFTLSAFYHVFIDIVQLWDCNDVMG